MIGFPANYGHNAFAFNDQFTSAGAVDETSVFSTVTIDEREVRPAFRSLADPYHLATGGALGRAHRGMKLIRLAGRILVSTSTNAASLSDMERAMFAAFDPALCYRDSPSTEGAYALDFSERTTNTAVYATGILPLRYYCRPDDAPRLREQVSEVYRQFGLALLAPDPRAYEQTEQTLALTPGSPTGNVLNRGTVPAPLKATIVLSGNGNSAFTITRSGVSFVLNLSSSGATTVVVVMETCGPYGRGKYITKGGVETFSLKTSGPSTWLDAPIGTTSFSITNTTNVTSCTLAWYSARA